jgi:hypothetical protein
MFYLVFFFEAGIFDGDVEFREFLGKKGLNIAFQEANRPFASCLNIFNPEGLLVLVSYKEYS